MPINIYEIDALIEKEMKISAEHLRNESNLKFVREKLLHGTKDEQRLIVVCSQLTMDHLNVLIEQIKDLAKQY